jgi:hypothetical protein
VPTSNCAAKRADVVFRYQKKSLSAWHFYADGDLRGNEQRANPTWHSFAWCRIMVILQRPRLEFRNADRTFKCFEVIDSIESTFDGEAGRPKVVVIDLKGFPVADRLRLMRCTLPKTIIVQGRQLTWTLEINHLEATISPTGLVVGLHGEFFNVGFKISPGSDFRATFPTYRVKFEAWIVLPAKMEETSKIGLMR